MIFSSSFLWSISMSQSSNLCLAIRFRNLCRRRYLCWSAIWPKRSLRLLTNVCKSFLFWKQKQNKLEFRFIQREIIYLMLFLTFITKFFPCSCSMTFSLTFFNQFFTFFLTKIWTRIANEINRMEILYVSS